MNEQNKQMNQPENSLVKKESDEMDKWFEQQTKPIKPPLASKGINQFVLNMLIPGAGTLSRGKKQLGWIQLGMALGSIPLFFIKIPLALLVLVGAYIWSIYSGIQFMRDEESLYDID